ncbi:MAG TPA: HAMP domain-containing sensor histidine kinase [Bryobacteraceae bacterium]|nr:HAMP domain-containing sensor histidine kinase [Bryobacteraceae bacterium]
MRNTLGLTPPYTPATGLGRTFGNLHIRPKLIVLHNLFFLVLSVSVYFAVIPPFERRVATARTIEINLIAEIFSADRPLLRLPKIAAYDYREGSSEHLGVPPEVKKWLDVHPGEVWQQTPGSDYLYRRDAKAPIYRRITLPNLVYDEVVERAKVTLLAVLGILYVMAVALLEFVIMPRYVYGPIQLMLSADEATRRGDRQKELINEGFITGDEIGQIMHSRNQTVTQLRQALDHLEAQDRLASLGLLSASVAHEMNTPLAVLHGSIEKLLETVPDPHAQDRLRRILRVTQRLRTISEGLVDFARVRKKTTEHVALKAIVNEAWELVAIDEKASQVRFTSQLGDNAVVVGNADRLVQVFVNLFRNSLNAIDSGGLIQVSARRYGLEGRPWVCVAVEDDGPGISRDVLPDIFDAFVSSRLDAKGTGLGLTVAQGIVQQHGGSIHAGNREVRGARLEVVLPGAEA